MLFSEKPVEKWAKSNLAKHSDPDRVEDVFPLAITYQSDPKEASGSKIKSYISKFYRTEISNDRLKRTLDSGVDQGLWELTSGNAPTGTYHLLIDTFNPGRSKYSYFTQRIILLTKIKTHGNK